MNTKGPLNLPGENALKIEREILALQPFPRVLARRHRTLFDPAMGAWTRAGVSAGNCRCPRTGEILAHHRANRRELPLGRL